MCTSGLCQGAFMKLPQKSPEGLSSPQGEGRVFSPSRQPSPLPGVLAALGLFPTCTDFLPTSPVLSSNYSGTMELDTPCLHDLRVPCLFLFQEWRRGLLGFCMEINQGDAACEGHFYVSIAPGHGVPRYLVKHDHGCVFKDVSGWVSIWICRLSYAQEGLGCGWRICQISPEKQNQEEMSVYHLSI